MMTVTVAHYNMQLITNDVRFLSEKLTCQDYC